MGLLGRYGMIKWVTFTMKGTGPNTLIVNPTHVVCITATATGSAQLTLTDGEVYDITDSVDAAMKKLVALAM